MNLLKERLSEQQFDNEFSRVLIDAECHFLNLHKRHGGKWHMGWGAYLFDGRTYEYCIDMYDKQKLLYEVTKSKNSVLEIGTYVGHSLLIMLLANPRLRATCIDISDEFAKVSTDYLQEAFPESEIEFIHKSSLDALPEITKKYDLFHIDGTHKNKIITIEFHQCLEKRSSDVVSIVFDDVYSCQKLLDNIQANMKVLESSIPGCTFSNGYFKLKV